MSSKLPKISFLDRVLSKRESPGKSDKKERHRYRNKVSSSPSSSLDTEEMPAYDDVSDLTPNQESLTNEEESPEYNCPPPPRPIYEVKSCVPAESQSPEQTQEFYDDVSAYQERCNKNQVNQARLPVVIRLVPRLIAA